jgi:hypothetical protein
MYVIENIYLLGRENFVCTVVGLHYFGTRTGGTQDANDRIPLTYERFVPGSKTPYVLHSVRLFP